MATTPFGRHLHRFPNPGISLLPSDAMPLTRLPYLLNMRSYLPGTIQPRFGLQYATGTPFLAGVHTLARLNDPTPFSTIKGLRIVGAAGVVYGGDVNSAAVYTSMITGFSGNPLAIVNAAPPQSPRPYAYIADSAKQKKVNSDKTVYPIGLAQPTSPPGVALAAPLVTVVQECNTSGDFAAVVGSASTGAPAGVTRVNTTIAAIVYDTGATGNASIEATSMANIVAGMRVTIAAAETCVVQECIPAVASTTIASIVFDIGTDGLCWIQPVASLGTGILDQIPLLAYTNRQTGTSVPLQDVPNVPADPLTQPGTGVARTRVVDFPVGGLITLGGATETVRILAVSVGPDGVQAIRCATASTHAAGDTITGLPTFRAFTTGTRAAGNTITAAAVDVAMTGTLPTGATSVQMVGGLSTTTLASGNLAQISGSRASLSEDVLTLSIKADQLTAVDSIRLYMDCDLAGSGAGTVFLENYFFAEWRASDIISAMQATNAAVTSTIVDARTDVVINNQIDPGPNSGQTTDNQQAGGGTEFQ